MKLNKLLNLIIDKLPDKIAKRKYKISIEDKIKGILYVLRTGISWVDLGIINNIEESNYRKFYYKLVNLKIFKKVMNEIKEETDISYIDSSIIVNKCGSKNNIGFCPQNKKHKGNKISVLVNDKGKPISCSIDKSSCHDLRLLDKTIDKSKSKIIVGDKGYTSKAVKDKLKEKGIRIIVPYKKNSKNKNSEYEKRLLKKRHIVENSFCNLKKLKRLGYRFEIKLKNFIGFVELGLLWLMV